ncbi:E3 ubiquitin-protein ligase TRIM45 isoform X1 [Lepisosteus oculatus]|uniref:E3 ubiquitin-protein ligase TRIM45 isoform X1 n=1 Tax=Lepisosteus oculatus TaxID=7918 RepID=UPI0035F52FD0
MSLNGERELGGDPVKPPVLDQGTASRANGQAVNSRAVCYVCKHLYSDPKILPCLHTFCADCIRRLEPVSGPGVRGAEASAPARPGERPSVTVLCPVCDSEAPLPPGGVDGLTTDHLALNDVLLESLLDESCELACDLCGEGSAERRCGECSANLCEFCCQAHRRQKKTSSHAVVRLQDLRRSGRVAMPVLCPLHPGEELRLFCETCDRPLCRECVVAAHREHACDYAAHVLPRHGEYIRQLVRRVQPHAGRLGEALRGVERAREAVRARAEDVAREVRAFTEEHVRAVERHGQELLRRLEDTRVRKSSQLLLQGAQLGQALADVRAAVDFAERLLANGSEAEILAAKGVTVRRLRRLAELSYSVHPVAAADDIRFLPQESAGQDGPHPLFGVISVRAVDPQKCVIHGEALQAGRQEQPGHFALVCRDAAGEPVSKGGENVQVSIVHTERKDCAIKAAVVDNNDGSYHVSYTPVEAGAYSVWVRVKGQHVKGSPFVLLVKSKARRHRGTFHCCTFCSSGGRKEARCGCGGTMPGGYQGCGHGHAGHPGKPHWSCCGSGSEDSECLGLGAGTGSPRGLFRTVAL